jgi:uncharacterized protein (TIGR02996 family)
VWPIRTSNSDAPPCGDPRGAEPFLTAIIADRSDDTARLVFADWLQENGDEERAEFIRIQCELHCFDSNFVQSTVRNALRPDLRAKCDRQLELATRNRAAWTVGFPQKMLTGSPPWFTRGFPNAAFASPMEWGQYGELARAWLMSTPTLIGLNELILERARAAELSSPDPPRSPRSSG